MKMTESQLKIKQGLTTSLMRQSSEILKFWIDFGYRFHIKSTVGTPQDVAVITENYINKLEDYAKTLPEYEQLKKIYNT